MCFPFLALKPPTQCFASSLESILLWWTERVPVREQDSCSSFLEVPLSKCQASSSIVENPKLSGRGLIKSSQTGCGEEHERA